MCIQKTTAPFADLTNEQNDSRLLTNAAIQKQAPHSMHVLLKRYNPFNWFNDFSNIHITLEEFSSNKNNQR